MATDEEETRVSLSSDQLLEHFRSLAANVDAPERLEPGDLTRAGVESMVASQWGTPREIHSVGHIRFTGRAIAGHSADLDAVGLLSTAWQRAVTATGAALEGIKSVRGRLSADVISRTKLVLTASPLPGSVVFLVEPKQSPMLEAEPAGQAALTPDLAKRPLADRASSALVDLLQATNEASPEQVDTLATQLRELGPRVGSAIDGLARAIEDTDVTLDVDWREPSVATKRAVVTPYQAKFLAEVVEGRGLNAGRETLIGSLATISDRQQWALLLGDRMVFLDMSELELPQLTHWRVHDLVEVDVRTTTQERPDGRVTRKYSMLAIRAATGSPTVLGEEEP